MVHQVICLGPVQHHDDAISVDFNEAVDKHDVAGDVSVCDDSGVDDNEGFDFVKSQHNSFFVFLIICGTTSVVCCICDAEI